jgi:hypothetical protein
MRTFLQLAVSLFCIYSGYRRTVQISSYEDGNQMFPLPDTTSQPRLKF